MRVRTVAAVAACVLSFAGAARAQTTITPEARQHFDAGVNLLQDPDGARVEDAYREFKKAYEIAPSPKILGNIGYCAMKLERDGEAIDAYSTYLREVPDIDAEERAQITRDLQTLTVGVARLSIEVDKPGATLVDVRVPVRGERITNTYTPAASKLDIGVRPGHHLITAKVDGFEDATWEVDAYASSRDKHTFAMQPKKIAVVTTPPPGGEPKKSTNIVPWIVAGAGGVMLIAGTVTGIVALGKTSDISNACPNDACPRSFDLDGARSSARTFVTVTDVLLIGGAVLAAGGVTWAILANGGDDKASIALGPSGVGGRF
ncbi:MAG TPA: hypothetical protein VIF62_25360 [Labilithrix sp.]